MGNQAVFKYTVNAKLSEVLFKWDTELLKTFEGLIKPIIENAVSDVKGLLNEIKSQDGKLIQLAEDAKAKVKYYMSEADKAISNIDFVPLRDFVVTSTSKSLKSLSEITITISKSLATGLDNIKANTPETVEKLREP